MTQTLEAVYDGSVIHPNEPIQLEANTRVRIIIESLPKDDVKPRSFLDTALSLKLEGLPPDFSENVDHYLYGLDKKEQTQDE